MKTITMSSLGKFGGFGNQLFQYAALMIYAKLYSLEAQVPADWIGRQLFDVKCPSITDKLPIKEFGSSKEPIFNDGGVLVDYDIKGYFQYHTLHYKPHKEYFKELFAYKNENNGQDFFNGCKNETIIGVHIRRGDYAKGIDRTAPTQWYLDWLKSNWASLNNPKLIIVSDNIKNVILDFEEYSVEDFASDDFVHDHNVLRNCNILLTSNSTFSFTAAMLNDKSPHCYRPDYEKQEMVAFDPWNVSVLSPFLHQLKQETKKVIMFKF